jgi:hypothetical protein
MAEVIDLFQNLWVHTKWKCFRVEERELETWPPWTKARNR